MEKYDNYKDSGIEWIGEIPEHWENIQIKHLAIGDNTLFLDGDWIESKEIIYDNGEYRYITTGNVGEGKYKEQGNTYITQETFEKLNCTEVVPDDLLISRLNPPIGRSCLVPDLGNKIVTSVDNVILRPSPKYKKNYLVHFFTNTNYFEYTSLVGRGATMQRISRSMLGDIKIALPPTPEEQTAIANYLDRKTTEIDELIADKKRLLELYEEEKTAIINQAVTKGINPNVPMKDSGIEWLGEIPEHWEILPIKYTANVQTGRTPKIANSDIDFFENGDTNWYTPGDFDGNEILKESKRKIISEAFEKNQVELFPKQSIYLVSIGATLGKVSLSESEASANQQINIISFNKEIVIPHWGYYFIVGNKEMVLNEADYTTLPILNQTKLKNIWIAFPNIDEQKNIIAHVNNELDRLRLKVGNTKKLIDLLTEYRTALISEVVTGKIKVTE
ncbi:restriction endonuclease subunit S [Cyclobacterium plantarum]|uniref:Restriction endonuclease subunit S n=1 Tax=Cyclobacterium plantarum TaxID=2716263 RepID=A0ABX0H9R1_9BACT|nr:restriction endonuclease subunit S [Cyclobacterium plantarum]NHE58634.1 restriction endonuclease subunit S [Cyclobacterium plantarum]